LIFCNNYIKQFFGITIVLLLFSKCEKSVKRWTIDTGSPLTILAPKFETNYEAIEWYYANRPLNSKTTLNTSFESARFTPDYPGDYDIIAELYDNKNQLIHFKIFKYHAIGLKYLQNDKMNEIVESIQIAISDSFYIDTLISSSHLKMINEDININTYSFIDSIQDEVEEKIILIEPQFTIQVFSLPDKQQAKAKTDLLSQFGFESYILPFNHPKFNSTWYRVRVGKFQDFFNADSIAKLLEQELNISTWIDKIN
tara:strand:- start:349 stop:1113 length:765 start_codon:yes stop_codon:yes gene_type:complete